MEHYASEQLISESLNHQSKLILPKHCKQCEQNKKQNHSLCSNCNSLGKSDISAKCNVDTPTKIIEYKRPAEDQTTSATRPYKRSHKTHVPSACINCKVAHLACDVSRPCKRCVLLNKTDTCQDMQHKKRGRPKLKEKASQPNDHGYEILYGTIQTPALFARKKTPLSIPTTQSTKEVPSISFIHESFDDTAPPADITLIGLSPSLSPAPSLLPTSSTSSFTTLSPTVPLLSPSSSSVTQPHTTVSISQNSAPDPPSKVHVTVIMSMEVCCVKTSDEVIQYWGYYPQELAHRSFYDFVSPKDTDRLAKLHQLLVNNAIDRMKAVDPLIQNEFVLPPTERTTSSAFSSVDQQALYQIAHGSRLFSDAIHVKMSSGEYELYDTIVYIGGGLGANLYDTTSLSKQYIVAQFKRHDYEVASLEPPQPASVPPPPPPPPPLSVLPELDYAAMSPFVAFSPLSPSPPTSPSPQTSISQRLRRLSEKRLSFHEKFAPSHCVQNSHSPYAVPKLNIAPITTQSKDSPDPSTLFNQLTLPTAATLSSSPACVRMSSTESMTVTHPTQQYFLQTSSSTLNAAASAAQSTSRKAVVAVTSAAEPTVVPNRKVEMSIRSLLC